jgi:hypothetical protein
MTNYKSLTINTRILLSLLRMPKLLSIGICLSLSLSLISCDKKSEGNPLCNSITLNKPFTAKIGETYCLPNDSWQITFGPFLEDSRCNVPGLDCFWIGRYVMAATIESGEILRDTFYADDDWRDTLYHAPYSIVLNKVLPEIRDDMEPLDTSAYSFEIIVK